MVKQVKCGKWLMTPRAALLRSVVLGRAVPLALGAAVLGVCLFGGCTPARTSRVFGGALGWVLLRALSGTVIKDFAAAHRITGVPLTSTGTTSSRNWGPQYG
jgi:hypothetical protein